MKKRSRRTRVERRRMKEEEGDEKEDPLPLRPDITSSAAV